ncbi:DUF4097 family beta strand repeat protein [candidate division KSB1 bacterium]|nr:DUF4097 family beta strand repeat protein [candidate division KSB1 bacterium]
MLNKKHICGVISLFFLGLITLAIAKEEPEMQGNRLTVQYTNPDKPGTIEASLVNGGITVVGYDGKEVIVEAKTKSKKITTEHQNEKAKGLFRIPVSSTGLTVEEENNVIEISVESWKRTIDLDIRVPNKTSLKLSCVNAGDISVENVEGEIDVNNINGKVTLANVGGTVIAHALNKALVVTLEKVYPEKSMSFSTLNGDIDVTLPSKTKANLKMKSDNGEIYSDFEIRLEKNPRNVIEKNTRKKDGKYRIEIEHAMFGSLNGGGLEMQFTSFNGDIYIRKGK